MEIEEGKPKFNGKYVCWVNNDFNLPIAKTMLLMCIDGQWMYPISDCKYRDHVYQFLGPLPALKLED